MRRPTDEGNVDGSLDMDLIKRLDDRVDTHGCSNDKPKGRGANKSKKNKCPSYAGPMTVDDKY